MHFCESGRCFSLTGSLNLLITETTLLFESGVLFQSPLTIIITYWEKDLWGKKLCLKCPHTVQYLHSQPDPAISSFPFGNDCRTILTTSTLSPSVKYGYSPLEPWTTRPEKPKNYFCDVTLLLIVCLYLALCKLISLL